MSLPRYERYKDSGVEWLGEVPEHWVVASLKRGFDVCLGKMLRPESTSSDDELHPYLRAANIQWSGVDISDVKMMWFSPHERRQLTLLKNDLLVSEGGDVGRSAIWQEEIDNCYFQNSINRVRPLPHNKTQFLYYWLNTIKAKGYIDVLCNKSTIAHFTAEKVQAVPMLYPSTLEQNSIIVFLDYETAKIDALIAEQQKLIEHLKEKRQAVISHAVTKGLNPDVKMKDSGIEWLGEVPEHWEITRIGNLFWEVNENGNQDLPVLSVSIHHGVSDKELDDNELDRKVTRIEDRTSYKRVQPGDLAYNMMRAWQGGFGTVMVDGMVSPAYVVARPRKEISTFFIELLLRTPQAIEQMRRHSRGITDFRLRLYWSEFKDIKMAMPPKDEAESICNYISIMDKSFSELMKANQDSIMLLQERRTALISAAVTGKIDVRGLVEPPQREATP